MAKAYVYWNEGEPWAVIVDGHVPEKNFLARARAIAKQNCIKIEGAIQHRYIRDVSEVGDDPWYDFCKGSQRGAKPVTVIENPPFAD
jgi:hypothetical protein